MLSVAIIVHTDIILSSVAGPLDMFTRTNQVLVAAGRPALFKVQLVRSQLNDIHIANATSFACSHTIADPEHYDLIIVPAFSGDWRLIAAKQAELITWLATSYKQGCEVASLCVGCYFLAAAGLLDNKACTSHWRAIADLQQRFPQIQVQADSVLTEQDGIYTGGGAFSSLNLVLYLIEKFCGHEVAITISKNFSIHRDHVNQGHFSVFHGQHQHNDAAIQKAQDYLEHHFRQDISLEEVANTANMSKRNFIRRFKKVTQNTPLEYLQRVKIEAAKKALEKNQQSVNTIMYDIGYSDSKTFRDVFKRFTGVTPQHYRQKYGYNPASLPAKQKAQSVY
jgi:transcriptional regulator GlxA family with amidase domain